jgi:hypothetical protein
VSYKKRHGISGFQSLLTDSEDWRWQYVW